MTRLPSRSKYGAVKTQLDGHKFDSKMEAEFYAELQIRMKAGEIADIILQPRYELEPRHILRRTEVVNPVDYISDFEVHYHDGSVEVIDVKGRPTPEFSLKAKLFKSRYPDLRLRAVRKKGKEWVDV